MKQLRVAVWFIALLVMASLHHVPGALAAMESEKLIFVVTVIRHGDRTPFAQLKNDPHTWKSGNSELTPLGMHQQFELGTYLRERYVDQFSLLPATYENGSVYALANGINRTIQSAQCLLFGLYPLGSGPNLPRGAYALPSGYQPIPLRTVPEGSSLLMNSYPEYQKILQRYVFNDREWVRKETASHKQFQQWERILGNEVKDLNDVLTIGDVLIVRKAHDIPRPEGLTQQDETEIIDLCEWALAFQFTNEKVSQLMGMELLETIKKDLEQASLKKDGVKFKLYSGHDTTILPLMKLMGNQLSIPPQYAAHMQIEIYQSGNDHLVRVRYNGKDIELPVMVNGRCSLEDFLKL